MPSSSRGAAKPRKQPQPQPPPPQPPPHGNSNSSSNSAPAKIFNAPHGWMFGLLSASALVLVFAVSYARFESSVVARFSGASDDSRNASSQGTSDCVDTHENCAFWASEGECSVNADYMLVSCAKSCNACGSPARHTTTMTTEEQVSEASDEESEALDEDDEDDEDEDEEYEEREDYEENAAPPAPKVVEASSSCADSHESCGFWAESGECEANPGWMLVNCQKSCNTCPSAQQQQQQRRSTCEDKHNTRECQTMQRAGECEKNPGWMIIFCGRSCGMCELQDPAKRCDPKRIPNYEYKDAYAPGDMNRMFERAASMPGVVTLLKPPAGPWVLQFFNVLSKAEADALLRHTLPKVKRSTDQGEVDELGVQQQVVSSGRTSSNAWCMDACVTDPLVSNLTNRIAHLVGVPVANFESYQVLQYKIGEKYNTHHDSSDDDHKDMAGPRILTFFIYLSDVEEGGETFFDALNLKVKPVQYSAILWPSTLSDRPDRVDRRTTHAALPVVRGLKLAANTWIHLRDFETPNKWGCTGSFDEPGGGGANLVVKEEEE